MTLYNSKIERMRVAQETTFGIDLTGSLGSFSEVPFIEGSSAPILNIPVETPGHAQQLVDGYPLGVHLPKNAQLTYQCNLETFSTKATAGVAPTQHWLGYMLECALGAKSLTTGTAITTGASTTVAPVSVATTIHPGCALGFNTGTGGAMEIREVKSKSGSNITLKHALSGSPSNAAGVLGSATYFCNPYTTGAEFKGIQFVCEGQNTEDRWRLNGGWLDSLTLTTQPGGIVRANFGWNFADWDKLDGSSSSGDTVGDTLGVSTYTNTNTLVLMDSEFRSQTVGTSTIGTLLHASTIEFRPNIRFAAPRTPAGVNTVLQGVRVHTAPVLSGSFVLPYEDETWRTARDNRTQKALWLQIGSSTTTGGVLISAPNVQIVNVQRVDVEGVINYRVDWVARLDADTTAESTFEGVAYSAFKMHFV